MSDAEVDPKSDAAPVQAKGAALERSGDDLSQGALSLLAAASPPSAPSILANVDRSDGGDDIFRRFRYQATYAAILALECIDPTLEIEEIYCEHHDDILVRLRSGFFRAIQIKTQDVGDPYRATDETILNTLVRFVELDLAFPSVFERFLVCTSASFSRSAKGHRNLPAALERIS